MWYQYDPQYTYIYTQTSYTLCLFIIQPCVPSVDAFLDREIAAWKVLASFVVSQVKVFHCKITQSDYIVICKMVKPVYNYYPYYNKILSSGFKIWEEEYVFKYENT